MFNELIRIVNLRDLGGFRTADGGTVRKNIVYRSGALTDLKGETLEAVRALGIRTIIDLRRNAERLACPTPWKEMGCSDYWYRDYDHSDADHIERMRSPDFNSDDSRAWMIALYAGLPYDQAEAYARLFRAIAHGSLPVLFHCAVGKDRTGVAAALILAVAGVARDDIVADFGVTARYDLRSSPHAAQWPMRSEERATALAPLLSLDQAYLDTMFDVIERQSGTIEAYLSRTLGLTEAEKTALKTRLVETAA